MTFNFPGFGSGSGDGFGFGSGSGFGDGFGDGSGSGDGFGDGSGSGYGTKLAEGDSEELLGQILLAQHRFCVEAAGRSTTVGAN